MNAFEAVLLVAARCHSADQGIYPTHSKKALTGWAGGISELPLGRPSSSSSWNLFGISVEYLVWQRVRLRRFEDEELHTCRPSDFVGILPILERTIHPLIDFVIIGRLGEDGIRDALAARRAHDGSLGLALEPGVPGGSRGGPMLCVYVFRSETYSLKCFVWLNVFLAIDHRSC